MATEKLAEGIRSFAKDTETLCGLLRNKLNALGAGLAGPRPEQRRCRDGETPHHATIAT